jgi:hypothetical protein
MSKLGLVVVMLLMSARINAQDYPAPNSEPPTYFVLVQADSGQAFYIRLDSQLHSSSPSGHLILAQLKDSVYTITVGFPGQIYPEQRYLLTIRQKDWALHLSQRDNRWGLFDSEGRTMPVVADPAAAEMSLLTGAKKEDAFSQMMAAIVRDTAVMYNTYAASSDSGQTPSAIDTPAISVISRDSTMRGDSVAPTTAAPVPQTTFASVPPSTLASVPPTAVSSSLPSSSVPSPAIPSSPTGVVKLSEHRSTQSLSLVYTDHPVDKKTDTIDVVIPVDTQAVVVRPPISSIDTVRAARIHNPDSTAANVSTSDTFHTVRIRKPSPDSLHSGPPVPGGHAPRSDTPAMTSASSHKSGLPFINSDCHAFATDYDVDKLRVRMLNAGKDDDRIQTAYKIFKTKCFTTRQVSALSEVFTTDAAKFKFLETAYPFVSDDRFPELVNLLSDPVYAGKFRTLTGRH